MDRKSISDGADALICMSSSVGGVHCLPCCGNVGTQGANFRLPLTDVIQEKGDDRARVVWIHVDQASGSERMPGHSRASRRCVPPPVDGASNADGVNGPRLRARARLALYAPGPTWAKLVRTLVDRGERLADVVGQGVFGGQGVAAGVDLDGAVAAEGADEFLDRPAGPGLDAVGDRQRGEHDGEVGVDGFAFVVVDRPGA